MSGEVYQLLHDKKLLERQLDFLQNQYDQIEELYVKENEKISQGERKWKKMYEALINEIMGNLGDDANGITKIGVIDYLTEENATLTKDNELLKREVNSLRKELQSAGDQMNKCLVQKEQEISKRMEADEARQLAEDDVKRVVDEMVTLRTDIIFEQRGKSKTETAFEDGDYEFNASHVDDDAKTAIEDDEVKTAIDEDETQSVLEDEEVKTAIGDDDFSTVGESGFGFTKISNLDQIFKCYPRFNLSFAYLTVEGNTLVYKRPFSATSYRKLVIHCEDGDIDYVTYEYCYGGIRGKCSEAVTYKRFGDMCPDANFCFLEVYIAVSNALSTLPMLIVQHGGCDQGLKVKFMANKEIHCTLEDQFISFTKDGQEFASSDFRDKMPAVHLLTKIIANLSKQLK